MLLGNLGYMKIVMQWQKRIFIIAYDAGLEFNPRRKTYVKRCNSLSSLCEVLKQTIMESIITCLNKCNILWVFF